MCGAGGCYCVTVMSSLGSTTQPNTALVSWPLLAVVVADGKWEWLSTSVGFSAKSHTSNVELCCAAYSTSLSYHSSEKFEPIEVPRPSPPDPIVYYQAEDLYVGSRVELNRHKFVLIDTDEYALRYMEKHCDQVWKCWVLLSRHILEWIEHISQHTFSY